MLKKIIDSFLKNNTFNRFVEINGFIIILLCIFCSIKMNIVGRTLWLDEAMLAISFNVRSFVELFHAPLEWNQSAPVGYLLFVKIFQILFGSSEAAFRSFSIIAYIGVLVIFYLLVKNMIKIEFPMLATAAVANIAILMQYSNMFKPYICDALSVLLILFIYYLFREKKINIICIAILYAILIWFSNPAAFMCGGVVLCELLFGITKKDKLKVRDGFIIGVAIVSSFILMYLIWLEPTLKNTNLSDFWQGYEFPINYTNRDNINTAMSAIKFVTEGLGKGWKIIDLLVVVTVVLNIFWKKNEYVWSITMSMIITLAASNLGFFPMSDRLFLFCLPILALMSLFGVKWLVELLIKEKYQKIVMALVIITFVISGTGIKTYHTGEAYMDDEETNGSISYLKENIEKEDKIFVYYPAIPVFMYKLGYDTNSVLGYENNVIKENKDDYESSNYINDIENIKEQSSIYLIFQHTVDYHSPNELLLPLNMQGGYLEKIHDKYLFHYSKDDKTIGRFEMKMKSAREEAGEYIVDIEIDNVGDTYLNNGFQEIYVHSDKYDKDYQGEYSTFIDNISPGEKRIIQVKVESLEETLSLYSRNQGKLDEFISINSVKLK